MKRRISSEELSSDEDYDIAPPSRKTRKASKIKHQAAKKKLKTTTSDNKCQQEVDNDVVSWIRPHSSSTHTISSNKLLREALLEWYAGVHEARGMPWRKPYSLLSHDGRAQRAYEVWISEIMLQQTQVATVIPYYNRWMEKFPTIRDLASSDIEMVNGLWKGLGYYSRAARLLSGAKKAVDEFDGRLPDNAKDMQEKIPGIGRYSAGAICSIAYNHCEPVLDGNVNRLLSRILALHASPKAKSTLDVLWSAATKMVEGAERPGDTNQALIELGSTVCKVREPLCDRCPLRPWCKAYELSKGKSKNSGSHDSNVPDIEELCTICEPLPLPEGTAGLLVTFPMKADRKKAREELDIVNIIEWRHDGNRWFLLVRRPQGGLLAGLHEFPTSANTAGASASAQSKIPHEILAELLQSPPPPYKKNNIFAAKTDSVMASGSDLKISKIKSAGDVIHVFSHIRKTYRVQWVLLEGGGSAPPLLASRPPVTATSQAKGKRKAETTQGKAAVDIIGPQEQPVTTKWVPFDEDMEANLCSTAVLKVWNQAKGLWDGRS